MKTLILGCNGNLGTQLLKAFSGFLGAQNNEVIGLDRDNLNILDFKAAEVQISSLKPDLLINATAYNAVDRCESDEAEFLLAKKLNFEAVKNLGDICLKNGITLVHYSTDYVFAGDEPAGYTEDSQTGPINNYGLTKRNGEEYLYTKIILGLKCYIIRTSRLFGPAGQAEVSKPSFFETIYKVGQEREELKIVDDEFGLFTYTPDLALATKNLFESGLGFGIYHLANSGAVSWYEATKFLKEISGFKADLLPVPGDSFSRPAKRPHYSELLNTKLPPLRSWREALVEYWGQCRTD